ncbi:MAG: ABC transporter permease [Lachnospiraceae bacterium]|nr:ABC transporter permease [Lachnospiraceae bacterium]
MFFKMLFNDLKEHKGLNIILFLFIIAASVISVAAAGLMYMEIVGRPRTDRLCNIANIAVNVNVGAGNFEEKKQLLRDWIGESALVNEGELTEYASVMDDEFSVNGFCASDPAFPGHKAFHLTTQPERISLLYNEQDKRFGLESGTMAISLNLSDLAGIHIGDEIRITTQLGKIYAFKVSEIYKIPANMGYEELIISPVDYEKLKADEPFRICRLLLRAGSINLSGSICDELYEKGFVKACSSYEYSPEIDPDYTILVVISYFLLFMSIAILLIVLITIRYMMIAAIKQEEKEIGMMRAIGVDSFRYRWMFAATYVSFALIGGIAGITAGAVLCRYILRQFCKNMIMRDPLLIRKTALIVSLSIVILILSFAALMMRRISRIPVVEALRGTDTGERFGRFRPVALHRFGSIRVPSFLAIADLVNSFGKYSFLIISYILAALILLTVFNLKSTLISPQYQRCFLQLERDVVFGLWGDLGNYYFQKGGDYEGAVRAFVEDANKEGIPLSVRFVNCSDAMILQDGKEDISATLCFGDTENEDIPLRKGGRLPLKADEAILSYYTARKEGYKIGDSIKLEFEEYDDDRIAAHTVQREFVICGFYDIMEAGEPGIIVGKEYTGAYKSFVRITNIHLEGPKSSHAAMIQKLKERFGEQYFETQEQSNRENFSYITGTIDALKIVFSVMIAFILALNTTLYTTVDLAAETPGIAILKCMGFSEKDAKKWQMLRSFLMLVIAMLIAYLLELTVVDAFAGKVFESFQNTGIHLVPDPLENLVIIPAIIFVIGMVSMRICLIRMRKINLWSIRED